MTVGLAITVAVFVELKPVAGVHVYVVPPVALSSEESPTHIVSECGVITNAEARVTATVVVSLHPPFDPMTV